MCGPILLRPTVTTGIISRAASRSISTQRWSHAALPSSRISKEVSKLTAAPRRPSTNRMYDNRWLRFANWATRKGIDPLGPTAAQIAAFLYELFDTHGLLPIKGYKSCSTSVLSHTGKAVTVQAENISK